MGRLANFIANLLWICLYPLRLLWRATRVVVRYVASELRVLSRKLWNRLKLFLQPIAPPLAYLKAQCSHYALQVIKYSVLFLCYVGTALFFAVIFYVFLYYTFVPHIAIHKPLYFDFRDPTAFPHTNVTLRPDDKFAFSTSHRYDFRVDLELPESYENINMGMFMVTITLYSWDGFPLLQSSRPAVLQFKTNFLRKMYTVFWSLPLVLGLMEEKQEISLVPIEGWMQTYDKPFAYAHVTLSKPGIHIYAATLHIEAKLSGLSYFAYHWFFTAFVVFVSIIFMGETFFALILGLTLWHLLSKESVSISITTERKQKKVSQRSYKEATITKGPRKHLEEEEGEESENESEDADSDEEGEETESEEENVKRLEARKGDSSKREATPGEKVIIDDTEGEAAPVPSDGEIPSIVNEKEEIDEGNSEEEENGDEEEAGEEFQPKDEKAKKVD